MHVINLKQLLINAGYSIINEILNISTFDIGNGVLKSTQLPHPTEAEAESTLIRTIFILSGQFGNRSITGIYELNPEEKNKLARSIGLFLEPKATSTSR